MNALIGLTVHGFFILTIVLLLLQVRRWKQYWPIAYFIAAGLVVMPIDNWLLIEFSRGYFTDLSMATILILVLTFLSFFKSKIQSNQISFNVSIIVMAVALYPASLGFTQFDPYAMGFASHEYYDYLLMAVAGVGIFCWYLDYHQVAIWLTLSSLAHGFQVYESNNIWNYLIDPLAVIVCLFSLMIIAIKKVAVKISKLDDTHVQSNA